MKLQRVSQLFAGAALVGASRVALADLAFLNQFDSGSPQPVYVGTGPGGQVIVTNYLASKANVYAPDGTFEFPLAGMTNPGENTFSLSAPTYSMVGPDGTLYVVDYKEKAVLTFGPTGIEQSAIIGSNASFNATTGIALSPSGTFYLATGTILGDANDVDVYNSTGQFQYDFASHNGLPTGFNGGAGVAVNAAGSTVFVCDDQHNTIDAFSVTGAPLYSFGAAAGAGQLNSPNSISVTGTGLVYVQDASNTVKVYSETGTYLETVASTANGNPVVADCVTVSPNGMVYVVNNYASVDRFFDPASWSSGTNTFTNSATGPTSVGVGAGQLLGTSFTLNSPEALVVGDTTNVSNGGIFNLAGGNLSTGSFVVDGATGGANFTMTAGNLSAGSITATGGAIFTQSAGNISTGAITVTGGANFTLTGGNLSADSITAAGGGIVEFAGGGLVLNLPGSLNVSGGTSQLKIDQSAVISATGLSNTGQLTAGNGADLIIFNNVTNGGSITLNGGELDIRGSLNNTAVIQGSGTLSTTGGLTNGGTLAFNGAITIAGSTTNTAILTVNNGSTVIFNGTYNGSLASTVTDNGILSFDLTSTSGRITGTGNLAVGTSVGGPATLRILPGSGASTLGTLSLNPGASLDLTNNSLVLQDGTLASVAAQIAQGYQNGNWNGSGITSSTAAGDTTHLTALGAILNDNGKGSPLYGAGGTIASTFGGASPVDGDVLVKYTYFGDANLDGKVDASDYTRIDNGYLNDLTGWFNGDFNYDGAINGSDYTLIDNAYNRQGASLTAQRAAGTAEVAGGSAAAVPEPASVCALLLVMAPWGRRRRYGLL